MKKKIFSEVLAVFLSVVMMISILPATVSYADDSAISTGSTIGTDGYYNVISKKDYTLVPGAATETEMVINNAEGTRRQVLHVIEVDPSNPDVSIVPGYYNIDKDTTNVANQQAAKLTDMAAYYEEKLGYNIVGGMNTDLYYAANEPRVLVYNGKDLRSGRTTSSVLCVYQDDGKISCEVKAYKAEEIDEDLASGRLLHAVGVSFGMVVKDGELVNKTVKRSSDDAARSMVGIKEDGTLVICMNDGRGANNSVGLSSYEEGEVMLALGCKWAANCDGGGSSTFLTKRVGEEKFTMRSVPCDGAERPTIHGIFVTSNVAPTGVLDNVDIKADYDYFAPTTTYTFDAEAIDTHGYAMDMPSDVTWALSDESFGTIKNGKFVSNGKIGDVDIQVVFGGDVVGSKTIHVSNPTTLEFASTTTTIPYSTVEKAREITLPFVARIGEANVYLDNSCFDISLTNANAGTIEGFKFTATTDTTVAGTTINAKYLPTENTISYEVVFGKGSEIVYDFEDGDVSNWMGFDEAKQWNIDNGVENTLTGNNPIGGQFSPEVDGNTFLSTTENGGQVKNGKYALGWNVDNTNANFASWTYNILYNVGIPVVLRDVANGQNATTFGMWVYIPEGAAGLAMQLTVYKGNSKETATSGTQLHFYFNAADGSKKNLNSCTESDIPESRWVYATVDLSAYNYVSLVDPTGNIYREPTFIRTYIKPEEPAVHTFYFDDFTLDYSAAVDDRILPTITDLSYTTSDTPSTLNNDVVIEANKMAFSAVIDDNEEIDVSSGKIYVDGIDVDTTISGKYMFSTDIELLSGEHTITFEVKDMLGNLAKVTRTINISGDATITLSGHNDSDELAEADSVYYVDINANDITTIDKVVTTLKLQTANKWELDHMIVADGFEASYVYNEYSKLATITVEKVDNVALTGAQTLVSLPVRVWSWNAINHITGAVITPESQFASTYCPTVSISCKVIEGSVTFSDERNSTFGGELTVETNLNDNINPWHYHDSELTIQDKDATCVSDGYSSRTYCETCGSVIDWGTKIEAIGHNYELTDGILKCSNTDCNVTFTGVWTDGKEYVDGVGVSDGWNGDYYYENGVKYIGIKAVEGVYYNFGKDGKNQGKYTGLFNIDGTYYYAINGQPVSGWQSLDDGWCYALSSTKEVVAGKSHTINGITYEFDENGRLVSGVWVVTDEGTKYSYGPAFYKRMWQIIDGDEYYFGTDGYMYTGIRYVKDNPATDPVWYDFGDGKVDSDNPFNYTGLYEYDGDLYYIKEGYTQFGLQLINGDYYYFEAGSGFLRVGYAAKDKDLYVNTTNGLTFADGTPVKNGTYHFDADGKMEIRNGVVDGVYYEYGLPVAYKGLVEQDGVYYYVTESGKVVKDKDYYVKTTNGLTFVNGTPIESKTYHFDAEGKMDIKNGVHDGYYYENGLTVNYAGLVKVNGSFYYVMEGGKVAIDQNRYVTNTNNLTFDDGTAVKNRTYYFDAEGKMDIQNGVYEGYYYENGLTVNYAGLVKVDGSYYYVMEGGKVAIDQNRYVTNTNNLTFTDGTAVKNRTYYFDAEGKMDVKNGVYEGYYYENGLTVNYAGLVKVNGSCYYVMEAGKVAINQNRYVTNTNDLTFEDGTAVKNRTYYFDEEGKMDVKNGVYDGYYYENGLTVGYAGLVKVDGSYYYVMEAGKVAIDQDRYLTNTNDLTFEDGTPIKNRTYYFDAEGKMDIKNGVYDGYYYKNGITVNYAGLVEVEGSYYYVMEAGKVAVNETRYVLNTNDLEIDGVPIKKGTYTFDVDGKMIIK